MRNALLSAHRGGISDFVIVSHNFEMLKPGSNSPDWVVVKRFERLCAFLATQPRLFVVRGFQDDLQLQAVDQPAQQHQPHASWLSTMQRYAEQIFRRVY